MKINLNLKFYYKDYTCQNEFGRFIFTKISNDKLDFFTFLLNYRKNISYN